MLISFMSLVKVQKIGFKSTAKTKRGEVKVMLTHGDWHDLEEVRKIYRDHPYGLKILNLYRIILPLHFILHNKTSFNFDENRDHRCVCHLN